MEKQFVEWKHCCFSRRTTKHEFEIKFSFMKFIHKLVIYCTIRDSTFQWYLDILQFKQKFNLLFILKISRTNNGIHKTYSLEVWQWQKFAPKNPIQTILNRFIEKFVRQNETRSYLFLVPNQLTQLYNQIRTTPNYWSLLVVQRWHLYFSIFAMNNFVFELSQK